MLRNFNRERVENKSWSLHPMRYFEFDVGELDICKGVPVEITPFFMPHRLKPTFQWVIYSSPELR